MSTHKTGAEQRAYSRRVQWAFTRSHNWRGIWTLPQSKKSRKRRKRWKSNRPSSLIQGRKQSLWKLTNTAGGNHHNFYETLASSKQYSATSMLYIVSTTTLQPARRSIFSCLPMYPTGGPNSLQEPCCTSHCCRYLEMEMKMNRSASSKMISTSNCCCWAKTS